MGVALPASPVRRADVLVATLRVLWTFGWIVFDLVQRATGTLRPALSAPLLLFLLVANLPLLPIAYGVAAGRRWGFGWMTALSALGFVNLFATSVLRDKPPAVLSILSAVIDALLLVYCVLRLRQTHVEWIATPRTPSLRVFDALVGLLGTVWMLGLVGFFFFEVRRPSLRADEVPFFALMTLVVVGYLAASAGVGFGRRWGFIAMIVASAFIVMSEVPNLWMHRPKESAELAVAVYSLLALIYCVFRLHRPKSGETLIEPLL